MRQTSNLIGALRDSDAGYKTADVIIYNKVVRLKLTEDDIKRSKNYIFVTDKIQTYGIPT